MYVYNKLIVNFKKYYWEIKYILRLIIIIDRYIYIHIYIKVNASRFPYNLYLSYTYIIYIYHNLFKYTHKDIFYINVTIYCPVLNYYFSLTYFSWLSLNYCHISCNRAYCKEDSPLTYILIIRQKLHDVDTSLRDRL